MTDDLKTFYEKWWNAAPWWFRLRQRLRLIVDSTWSAIRVRPGPGERILLAEIARMKSEQQCKHGVIYEQYSHCEECVNESMRRMQS